MKKPTKPIAKMEIEPAQGGFIVRHTFDNRQAGESYRPSEKHVVSADDLIDHVMQHLLPESTKVTSPMRGETPGQIYAEAFGSRKSDINLPAEQKR